MVNGRSITITPAVARRLAISRQWLAGERPASDSVGILALVQALGCLQLDPISVVERSHRLVLFSRLGAYPLANLDELLWQQRSLFEYWAHCASIVPMADYPLHRPMMEAYAVGDSAYATRVRQWVSDNDALRQQILDRLRAEGPLLANAFAVGGTERGWISSGWTSGRDVARMLDYLWIKGEIMVAGRSGIQKRWDLAERCRPDWVPLAGLPEAERVRQAAQRALRALGVARPVHIQRHFLRGRYPGLTAALADLERAGTIERIAIADEQGTWPGPWYLHQADRPRLEELLAGDWQGQTTLLSPFDNLICDRQRTAQLFGFDFRIEIYTPRAKRRYGYYVLPILHNDQLIGRLDPVMERRHGRLTINALYAEPGAPTSRATARSVAQAVEALAGFLGARQIVYPPAGETNPWRLA